MRLKRPKERERQREAAPDLTLEGMTLKEAPWETSELSRRHRCVDDVVVKFSIPERFARKVLGHLHSTRRNRPEDRSDEEVFTADILRSAPRYGWITAMLQSEGDGGCQSIAHSSVEG